MKKTLFAISAIAVLLGFTACTSENETLEPQKGGKTVTIKAYTEEATRTALDGNDTDGYKVLWEDGDKIKIGSNEFTLASGAGTTAGEFSCSNFSAVGPCHAYYPSTYDGTNWPTAQTYVAGNIPDGVPMKSDELVFSLDESNNLVSDKGNIKFKNEGGILRLNLTGTAKVTSIKISATNLDKPITLDCGSTGVQLNTTTATPFYIAVPVIEETVYGVSNVKPYSGLKIEITDNAGAVCTKTAKSDIAVQRSKITNVSLKCEEFKSAAPEGSRGKETATIGGGNVEVNWVQLWADGPKFAEFNVGATSATEYGGYYSWGGTYANGYGIEWEGSYCKDNISTLCEDGETATNIWGSKWRMPTQAELQALLDNCTCTWDDTNKGFLCTGKDAYSSNSIFLPAAGDCWIGEVGDQGKYGLYWSSTQFTPQPPYELRDEAYYLFFDSSKQNVFSFARSLAFSIRAVLNESAE